MNIGDQHANLEIVNVVGGRVEVRCRCQRKVWMYLSEFATKLKCGRACPMSFDARKKAYSTLKHDAKRRGLEVSLSFDEFVAARGDGGCHYCGAQITTKGGGLDRINNELGYETGNVVACCTMCNWARGGLLTHEEFAAAMALRVARTGRGAAWPDAERREQARVIKARVTRQQRGQS